MLTTASTGRDLRQWLFIALLFVPIFGLIFLLGVFVGRSADPVFPTVLCFAIIATIGSIIALGLEFRIGIYIIMLLVMWDRLQTFGEAGTVSGTKIAIGLTIIFLLAAILGDQLRGWSKKLGDPLIILGVLFLICCLAGVPFMPHPELATEFINRRLNVVALMGILILAVADRDVFHRCVLCLVIGGTLVAIATTSEMITGVGLLERFGKSNVESSTNVLGSFGGTLRVIGPSGDPVRYSLAQSIPGALAFGLLLYYRRWWQKALLVVALLFIGVNIAATGSRGGALAFSVASLIVFLTCPVKHRFAKLLFVAVVVVSALAIISTTGADIAAQRIADPTEANRTVIWRLAMWRMAYQMFLDHPIVGIGTNAWGIYYNIYRDPEAPASYLRVHSAFLQLLAENGLQGMLVYIGFYVAAAGSAYCAALGTFDRRLKFEATAIASTTFGLFVGAGTSNVLENELYFIVFGLCGAAYYVYLREAQGGFVPPTDLLEPSAQVRRERHLRRIDRSRFRFGR
ncbi:MAG: O-antigen ligase family protein [Phycisphaerales bacterium]|nr:O-antigen ligase family protein [Phycisphaerales bacterium]